MSRCVHGLGLGWRVCPPRGYSAHTGRIPGRHKNGKYAAKPPARPAFQRHEAHVEGSDTAPAQKCRKNAKRESYHLPQQGSRRNPAKRFRWEEDERQRASPAACGGTRDSSSARTTGQHRICLVCGEAAALPNAPGGAWPRTPFSGGSPDPLKAASVSAETLLPASGGAASKGDQSPFEEPPALRGDERNNSRKVIHYEKRYQIQHAHGVR